MKTYIYRKLAVFLCTIFLLCGCKDDGTFDNNVYLVTPTLETILNRPSVTADQRTLQIGVARPEIADIKVDFMVDPSSVDRYNKTYDEKAVLLSED